MATNGINLNLSNLDLIKTMALPALGMLIGLLFAVFVSYRKERKYSKTVDIADDEKRESNVSLKNFVIGVMAIAVMFILQVKYSSILLGACAGFLFLLFTGTIKWNSSDVIISEHHQKHG
jgi:predicted histidine transporter YuiF (NhaC family)